MEEAEHALWRAAGLAIFAPDEHVSWPRVAASFDFRRPLRFEEEFDIAIEVSAITERSIRYTCVITRGDEEIATGSLTIACVERMSDRSMKAVPIPAGIAARLQAGSAGAAGR
jgi:acyl-CoA thioesterase FadM